jgi:hypothetical protein
MDDGFCKVNTETLYELSIFCIAHVEHSQKQRDRNLRRDLVFATRWHFWGSLVALAKLSRASAKFQGVANSPSRVYEKSGCWESGKNDTHLCATYYRWHWNSFETTPLFKQRNSEWRHIRDHDAHFRPQVFLVVSSSSYIRRKIMGLAITQNWERESRSDICL